MPASFRLTRTVCTHVCFIMACWILVHSPGHVHYLPGFRYIPTSHDHFQGPRPLIALHLPTSRYASWQLGQLLGQWDAGGSQAEDVLAQASMLLQLPTKAALTIEQLQQIGPLLAAADSKTNNSVKRILGLMSLVNLMWLAGIVGICATIGPTAYILFEPALRRIYQLLAQLATQLAQALHRLIIRLKPVWEVALFVMCFYISAAAQQYPAGSAVFIALTGQCLAVTLVCYQVTTGNVSRQQPMDSWDRYNMQPYAQPRNLWSLILSPTFRVNMFAALTLASTAVLHQSQLAGFLSVLGLFSALGFVVIPFSCGWAVGWHNDHALVCSKAAAGTLLLGLVGSRLLGLEPAWVNAFQLGVSVMGSNCLFLAGLIQSSLYYKDGTTYLVENVKYVAFSLGCIVLSSLMSLIALRNTAITYLVLWASQKAIEIALKKAAWVAVFASSLALWRLSLFLSSHPDWLASLLKL